MKKFFGILFILIGICLIVGGVSAISSISTSRDSFEGRVHESVSYEYRSSNDEKQMAGMALIGGGVLLLVIGIIMTVSKSKSQKEKEIEYKILKKTQSNSSSTIVNNDERIEELSNKVKEYYSKKEYNYAISAVKQLIELTPNDSRRYIDLASLYSLTQNLEAFSALEKAVSMGYSNFEKIETSSTLTWLKSQPEYEKFVTNGYKIIQENAKHQSTTENRQENETPMNDDKIQKLEKLAELRDKGILTDEEFQKEKSKILN